MHQSFRYFLTAFLVTLYLLLLLFGFLLLCETGEQTLSKLAWYTEVSDALTGLAYRIQTNGKAIETFAYAGQNAGKPLLYCLFASLCDLWEKLPSLL